MAMDEVRIHPSAVVAPGAKLGRGTEVCALAVVGAEVELGADCWVGPHSVLAGNLRAGDRNRFFPFCSVGGLSQDLWRRDEVSYICMGDDNVVREGVTINSGTSKEYRCTSLGNHNNIMAGCHVAHDCVIGNHVTLANNVLLGGHVRIRDHASVGGATALHHFVTVGRNAFVGGFTRCVHDVPPWMLLDGIPARVKSVNLVGARRAGLPEEEIAALREAYRRLFHSSVPRRQAIEQLSSQPPPVLEVIAFLHRQSAGSKGRHLERYRRDDRTLDTESIPEEDRPPCSKHACHP